MSAVPERPEFLRGRAAERMVASWLQGRGWFVIPSYDYSGEDGHKVPRLQGIKDGHIVPDLDVARDGGRKWIEVKAKEHANVWRHPRQWGRPNVPEHGIDESHWRDYLDVKRITGDEVWIAIYEEDTGLLLVAEIDGLGEPRPGTCNGTRMVNWPREQFHLMPGWES